MYVYTFNNYINFDIFINSSDLVLSQIKSAAGFVEHTSSCNTAVMEFLRNLTFINLLISRMKL